MLFWIIVAVLTAAVAAVMLMPLLRADAESGVSQSHDVEVYRDQLEELKRDERNGLLSREEAEFARAEVARRLIAASEAPKAGAGVARNAKRGNRLAQLFVIVILPAVGLCLYLRTGNPDMPDAPLAARLQNDENDPAVMLARVEQHLVAQPNDGPGWDLLAPIYYRSGRIEDSVAAFRNALRLLGPSSERLGGFAESLIALSDGLVTDEAKDALEQSLALQPDDLRVQFYLALALKQEGKGPQALAAFQEVERNSPREAPWLPLVERHIASLDAAQPKPSPAPPGNPSGADIAAADSMNAADRAAMIEGMVTSLEQRLKDDPNNFEGWMRIIRSYSVLGQKGKAEDALKQGLAAFPAAGSEGKQLLALAGELGLATDGGDTR